MHVLKNLIQKAVQKSFPDGKEFEIIIETPNDEKFGDFSSNIAMQLVKKIQKSPREIAQGIIDAFPANTVVDKIEIAGPGFLNFYLTHEFLEESLKSFDPQRELDPENKLKICIDSSHPNIAKPLHFGHLRSTLLGECLARLFHHAGHEVLQDNFIGDWGTQFGKLVVAIRKWGDQKKIHREPIVELTKLYQKFHQEAENNPELEKQGAEEFRKMEVDGDEENLTLWRWIVDESLKEVQKFYSLVDAHFDCIRGESHWETMIESTFEFMKKKKILVEGERGALVVHFPEETKLPTMLYKRSDGATLYQTRDLTRILYYDREGYDILLHVVGSDQFMHFKRVFETAKMLGIAVACEHIDFGLVRLPEGKMSTRKGITIDLMNIFEEAERRVRASLDERNIDFSQEEKEKLVKILSVGAVKFNDLSQNRTTDITFNWEKMLSFEGFSAPFLQYSYARANSIFKKDRDTNFVPDDFVIQQNAEKRLTKKILQFPQIVIAACEKRAPHLMAQYLYELASVFNSFYVQCPILKAPEKQKKSRLFLTKKMSETLKKGLCLLTIEAPERM